MIGNQSEFWAPRDENSVGERPPSVQSRRSPAVIQAVVLALMREHAKARSRHLPEQARPEPRVLLNEAIKRSITRLLPGAQLIRKARPMTDILQRFKKKSRRILLHELLMYRGKVVKGPQKALVTKNRKQALRPYKR